MGRAHRLLGRGELDGLGHDVGPVQMLAQLPGSDVVGGPVRPPVDLPAHDLVGAGRARIIALRRPDHPFAVLTAENGDDQLAGLQIPKPYGLIGGAGNEIAAIRRCSGIPDRAFVAHEIPKLLAIDAVGGESAEIAANDYGLAGRREANRLESLRAEWIELDGCRG